MVKTNFDEWFSEFEKAWDVRMIENEHLKKICFLEMLSCINKVRYIYGGQYKTVNLSSFKVQQSGTGKGVADKLVGDCLKHLGYKTEKFNSFTEAAIIGSLSYDSMGKVHIIKGALGDYDFIWIDEARNLIVGNNWTQGLLEVINGYLDDGMIFKRLARGEIKYWSNCSFGTGTFFFSKLKPTILATGIFQRCLFSYKIFKKDDILRISKAYNELANKSWIEDLLPVMERLKEMKNKLSFDKYNISKNKDHPNYVIKMNMEASRVFGEEIDKHFNEEIFEKVRDKRLNDILTSFLIRSKELGHKIMCIYAVWNGKDIIDEECARAVIPIIKEQLGFVLDFVRDVFEGTGFDSEDLVKEDVKRRKIKQTELEILKLIRDNPGKTKMELRVLIKTNKKDFMVGESLIFNEVLPEVLSSEKVRVEQGDTSAEKKIYIVEIKKESKKS